MDSSVLSCKYKKYLLLLEHIVWKGKGALMDYLANIYSSFLTWNFNRSIPTCSPFTCAKLRHNSTNNHSETLSCPHCDSQIKGSFRINTHYGPFAAIFATSYWGRQMHTAIVTLPTKHSLMRQYVSTLEKQQILK